MNRRCHGRSRFSGVPLTSRRLPMTDSPSVTQSSAQPAAVLRLTIPRSEIRSAMGPARTEVLAAVAAQGVAVAGPLFSHHFRMAPETFDFVVGVPVAAPVAAVGRVTPGELPAARVARTVSHGPYEGLGAAWGAFETWIATEGHARRPDLWERYLVGPESGAEPSAWQTELSHPLVAG